MSRISLVVLICLSALLGSLLTGCRHGNSTGEQRFSTPADTAFVGKWSSQWGRNADSSSQTSTIEQITANHYRVTMTWDYNPVVWDVYGEGDMLVFHLTPPGGMRVEFILLDDNDMLVIAYDDQKAESYRQFSKQL